MLIRLHGWEALCLHVLPEILGGKQRMLSDALAINLTKCESWNTSVLVGRAKALRGDKSSGHSYWDSCIAVA